jgi:TolB protein
MTHTSDHGRTVLAAAVLATLAGAGPGPARAGTTEWVSIPSGGGRGGGSDRPAISADGRFVAFDSYAADLVRGDTNGALDVFVRDRKTGTTRRVSMSWNGKQGDGASGGAAISAGGRFVAFDSAATNLVPGDTNAASYFNSPDRTTGTT